eukprot:445987_1
MKKKYDKVPYKDSEFDHDDDDVISRSMSKDSSKRNKTYFYCLCILIAVILVVFSLYKTKFSMIISFGDTANSDADNMAVGNADKYSSTLMNTNDMVPPGFDIMKYLRDMFDSFDIDGDYKLNMQEFTEFIAVAGNFGGMFTGFKSLLPGDSEHIFTVKDIAIALELNCHVTETKSVESCEEYAAKMGCSGEWRECLEVIAYGIITTITGDIEATEITKKQLIQETALRTFTNIKQIAEGDSNDAYVDAIEFEIFQNKYIDNVLEYQSENTPGYSHQIESSKINEIATNYESLASTEKLQSLKKKVLKRNTNEEQRRLLSYPYTTHKACCFGEDCDSWDVNWCGLVPSLCLSGCLGGAIGCLGGALCAAVSTSWCAEVYHCIHRCDCWVERGYRDMASYLKCPSECDSVMNDWW